MLVLAIGDIHTKAQLIYNVAELVNKYDAIVFCGDYADDWNAEPQKSILTWKTLKMFHDSYPDKVKPVLGNHDYIYVNKTPTLQSGYNHITQLLINDPSNREVNKWLQQLPIELEIDNVIYSHAGITEDFNKGDELWQDTSPLWARPPYARYRDTPQVFGHTPQPTCTEVLPNRWCIDTFSTYPDGKPIGDGTALEIIDGKEFNKILIR